jgi:hypothetical protein
MAQLRAGTAALALGLVASALPAAQVRFQINDAHVRGKRVAGVQVLAAAVAGGEPAASAETDQAGVAILELEPATYWVSYLRRGYVPIRDSETEIRGDGQVITTTLSMLLEAESGGPVRRVRLVLNWGSDSDDARDVDGHATCTCGQTDAHVYYGAKRHEYEEHALELDVDDMDWGGPETITFSDPPPGTYSYLVHQYSQDRDDLGRSDLVVRVFFDDYLAAEIRGPQSIERYWRPFKQLIIGPDLTPRLVRFDAGELAGGANREPPAEPLSEASEFPSLSSCSGAAVVLFLISSAVAILAVRRHRARLAKKLGRRA